MFDDLLQRFAAWTVAHQLVEEWRGVDIAPPHLVTAEQAARESLRAAFDNYVRNLVTKSPLQIPSQEPTT